MGGYWDEEISFESLFSFIVEILLPGLFLIEQTNGSLDFISQEFNQFYEISGEYFNIHG